MLRQNTNVTFLCQASSVPAYGCIQVPHQTILQHDSQKCPKVLYGGSATVVLERHSILTKLNCSHRTCQYISQPSKQKLWDTPFEHYLQNQNIHLIALENVSKRNVFSTPGMCVLAGLHILRAPQTSATSDIGMQCVHSEMKR